MLVSATLSRFRRIAAIVSDFPKMIDSGGPISSHAYGFFALCAMVVHDSAILVPWIQRLVCFVEMKLTH
jgi:hypothetical protein